jgi:hypothetical protein
LEGRQASALGLREAYRVAAENLLQVHTAGKCSVGQTLDILKEQPDSEAVLSEQYWYLVQALDS